MESHFMEWFDMPVKFGVLCLCAFGVFLTVYPHKATRRQVIAGGLLTQIPGMIMAFLRDDLAPFHVAVMVGTYFLVLLVCFRVNHREIFTASLMSFGLAYIAFTVSAFLVIFAGILLCEWLMGDYHRTDIFFESATVHVVTVLVMQVLEILLVWLMLRRKRVQSGLRAIVRLGAGDVGIYVSLMILQAVTLYRMRMHNKLTDVNETFIFVVLTSSAMLMYFWIRREIKAVYIRRMLTQQTGMLQKRLEEQEHLIASLREDNDRLGELIHKDNKLIPAMVGAVRQLAEGHGGETADVLVLAEQFDEIYRSRGAVVARYEAVGQSLPSLGAASSDAIFSYMVQRARNDGITLTADALPEAVALLDQTIPRHDLNTVLADLTENALLAVKECGEGQSRAVAVTLGVEGENAFLRVADSGVPFDPQVLRLMGRKKVTTRRAKGGSGTGLMTLFKLLEQYGASLRITHYAAERGYAPLTKDVTVLFDGKHDVTIEQE